MVLLIVFMVVWIACGVAGWVLQDGHRDPTSPGAALVYCLILGPVILFAVAVDRALS